jgi:hypothetical protein
MESRPMNEFGEPNMGNPSVRFDEGPERAGHWPLAFQSILSRLLYNPLTDSTGPRNMIQPYDQRAKDGFSGLGPLWKAGQRELALSGGQRLLALPSRFPRA